VTGRDQEVVQAVAVLDGVRHPGWLVLGADGIRLVAQLRDGGGPAREQELTHRGADLTIRVPRLAVLPVPRAYLELRDGDRTADAAVGRWMRRGLIDALRGHGYDVTVRRTWWG
jgi:hypothetical protein